MTYDGYFGQISKSTTTFSEQRRVNASVSRVIIALVYGMVPNQILNVFIIHKTPVEQYATILHHAIHI